MKLEACCDFGRTAIEANRDYRILEDLPATESRFI